MHSLRAPVCSRTTARSQYKRVRAVASAEPATKQLPKPRDDASHRDAVLLSKWKAHEASVSALLVTQDKPDCKRIITASLDKTLQQVTLEGCDLGGPQVKASRVEVAGGPVFSLHPAMTPKITGGKPIKPVVFCGLAAKEIAAWQPDRLSFNEQVRMNGHSGWVRSLASSGKFLFSCGCNHLRQWDQAFAVPKEVGATKLFTGDILAIAASDSAVFTAGADGSLRAWSIGKRGELAEAGVRERAHDGRITSLLVAGSLLFSAGYDGDIKAWDCSNLKLVMQAKAAHNGERVRTLIVGPGSCPTPSSSNGGGSNGTSSAASRSTSNGSAAAANATPADCDPAAAQQAPAADECQCPLTGAAASPGPPASSAAGSAGKASCLVLYSGGDDGLVRRWDARLLVPAGEPLQVHKAAVKALAAGDKETLVSGDAAGEVAVWLV